MDPKLEKLCWDAISLQRQDFFPFRYQKYNPKTKHFTIGLLCHSDDHRDRVLAVCGDKFKSHPKYHSHGTWRWNKRYVYVKFKIDLPSNKN